VATLHFELISPERVLFAGDVRAVMLPGAAGDMTVMPGHEPTVATLNPASGGSLGPRMFRFGSLEAHGRSCAGAGGNGAAI
jgi:ATP synthase, Delta/Epsilon chain, beta-sandwich domain